MEFNSRGFREEECAEHNQAVRMGCILDHAFRLAQTAFIVNVLGAGDPLGSF